MSQPLPEYYWIAHYRNGDVLAQYDLNGTHSTEEVDRTSIVAFTLARGGQPVVTLVLAAGQRFLYRRRTAQRTDGTKDVAHIIAQQKECDGQPTWFLFVVRETGGEPLRSKGWKPHDAWLSEPEYVPADLQIVGS